MSGTPKLIVLSSQLRGKQFELVNDLYTVGRVGERDICLKDSSVSSHHCDFVRSGDTFLVRDNGSTNGTRVNNTVIKEQKLNNSDIIQIGGIEVLFDTEDKSESSTTQRTVTGITITDIDPDTLKIPDAKPIPKQDTKPQKVLILIAAVLVLVLIGLGIFLAVSLK